MSKKKENSMKTIIQVAELCNNMTNAQILFFMEALEQEAKDRKLTVLSKRKKPSWILKFINEIKYS